MESVLVGVDQSEAARRAARFALSRANLNSWSVTLVHVVNWSRFSFNTQEDNADRPRRRQEEIQRAQAQILDPILAELRESDLPNVVDVKTGVFHGQPSQVLADIAQEAGQDIIVVGRTGESNVKTAIFGSVPSRLVQHAPVPVVVVP